MLNNTKQILIIDDHKMLQEGIDSIIKQAFSEVDVFNANSHKSLLRQLAVNSIDILLLDIILGNEDSRSFLDQIKRLYPKVKIIIITSLEETSVVQSLFSNGVKGFVCKSSSSTEITDAIEAVDAGETYIDKNIREAIDQQANNQVEAQVILTRREKEVLVETLNEKKIKEIAECLFISEKTVENHRANLFAKFEVNNVTGLVKKAILMGYLPNH